MGDREISLPEIDERMFELYVSWCRAHNVKPDISQYPVWLADQDYDDHYFDGVDNA